MVYVFKKLNNLTGDNSAQSSDPSAVISSDGGASSSASPGADPYKSTYQNPSNIYNANLGENLGKLDNGIGKSISDTQQNLTDSSGKYKGALDTIDSGYKFNGRPDLENINDTATFSRLNSMVNPAVEQTQLNAEQSNTRNYNPDTAGLAASSTISGLSNQLKNQYGTTAGGARLDAQLYRGSGQAGKAINENLGQLGDFRVDKEKRLGEETNLLSQYNQGAADRSASLINQAGGYQGELKADAKSKASAMQSQFDTQRQNAINSMAATRDNTDYKTQLQNAIDQAFGDRKITQAANNVNTRNGNNTAADISWLTPEQQQEINTNSPVVKINGQQTRMLDFTPYLKQNLLNDFSKQVDLSGFDPSKYVGAQQTFNSDSYLDPRYNQISKLIGGPQVAGTTTPDGQIHADTQGYQDAINSYLSQQTSQAQQAVQGLFNPAAAQGAGRPDTPYSKIAMAYALNPALGGAMAGNELFKNAGSYLGDAGSILGGLF